MPHQRVTHKLGRNTGQRRALLKSLTRSLVIHERITTPEARAKALRPVVERFITWGCKAAKAMDRRPRTRISPHSIGLLNKVLVKASRSASPADLATSSLTSPMFLKVQIAMKPIKNGAMA